MKPAFRLFRRKRIYWSQNNETGKQKSLHTSDKDEARRLLNAKNEAAQNPAALNIQIGRNYLAAADPEMAQRTWKDVFDRMLEGKKGSTRERFERAGADKAYEPLWNFACWRQGRTTLTGVLEAGTVATNFSSGECTITPSRWAGSLPESSPRGSGRRSSTARREPSRRRSIARYRSRNQFGARARFTNCAGTREGHRAILHHLSQDIIAKKTPSLTAAEKPPSMSFRRWGPKVKAILAELPLIGPLFPHLKDMRASDRATEFKRACRRAEVLVSLSTHTATHGRSAQQRTATKSATLRQRWGTIRKRWPAPTHAMPK